MVSSPSRGAVARLKRSALKVNFLLIKKQLSPGCGITAVVKANAYGTGAVQAAKTLATLGVDSFAVATLEEGLQLKKAGLAGEVLCLGPVEVKHLTEAARANIGISASGESYLRDAAKAAVRARRTLKIHLKFDSGMHRLGFEEKGLSRLLQSLSASAWEGLVFESAYTHFGGADSASLAGTSRQLARFLQVEWPESFRLHACNSIAALRMPQGHLSMVRLGIFLYGGMDPRLHPLAKKQREVLSLSAPVIRLQTVEKGQGVSYGPAWRAKKKTTVATLALGYADGLPRRLSNGGSVLVAGKRCPIIGRVCMDLVMVNVSHAGKVRLGSTAVFIGKQGKAVISIQEWARLDGTIAYESLTRISDRVPRVWVDR